MPEGSVPNEADLISHLDKVDSEIKAIRQQTGFERDAESWLRLRNGAGPSGGEEPIFAANLLGNFIERKIAALTQSQPDIRVSGRAPEYAESAVVLTDTCKAVLDHLQLDARIETASDLAATFGFVGFNTAWHPNADYGRGDIVITVLDPRRFFVDHHVKDVTDIQKAQYIRIDTPMPLDDVKRMWPDRAAELKPDMDHASFRDAFTGIAMGLTGPGGRRPLRPWSANTGPYEWTIVREYWLRSNQLEGEELVFPNGRLIHRSGNIVLDDQPNPYWDGLWPVDIMDWRVNGDSYMGRSDVEEVRKLQETINRVGNSVAKNIILSCVITVLGDSNALSPEDWKKLDNRAARILKKQPGRELQFIPPPAIPDQYLQFVNLMSQLMETLLGVPPSMQGKRQPGVIASSAVEGLMTQAETLIRATARRLEYVIERIGVKLISRIIQFYTSDRIMTVRGQDADLQDYTFRRTELLDAFMNTTDPAERDAKLKEYFTNFRFRVAPMSALPSNKIQRGLMAMNLFSAGLIDAPEALRTMEWPDWKHVLERTQKGQAAAKEQAMQEGLPLAMMGISPKDIMPQQGGGKPKSSRDGTKMKMS